MMLRIIICQKYAEPVAEIFKRRFLSSTFCTACESCPVHLPYPVVATELSRCRAPSYDCQILLRV